MNYDIVQLFQLLEKHQKLVYKPLRLPNFVTLALILLLF